MAKPGFEHLLIVLPQRFEGITGWYQTERAANRFFVVDWLSGNVILPKEYLLVSSDIVAKAAILKSLLSNSHAIQAVEIVPMAGETIATTE